MLNRRFRVDLFSLLLAAMAAGSALVLGLAWVSCLVIAAAVVAVNVLLTLRVPRKRSAATAVPDANSAEGRLLSRGHAAAAAFAELAGSLPHGLLADRSREMRRQAAVTLDVLIDLGRQSAMVGRFIEQLGGQGSKDEREGVRRRLARAEGRQKVELRQSLQALERQGEIRRNLAETKMALRSRMEALTFGLEGLVARLAELSALAQSGSLTPGDDRIEQLALELEGLRAGLVQAEDVNAIAAGMAGMEED